jgi:hypothetical protein
VVLRTESTSLVNNFLLLLFLLVLLARTNTAGRGHEDSTTQATTNVPFKRQASGRGTSGALGSGYYVDDDDADEVAQSQPPSKPTTPKPSFMRPSPAPGPGAAGEIPDAARTGRAQQRDSFGLDDSTRSDQAGKAQTRGSSGTDGRRKSVFKRDEEEEEEEEDESRKSPAKAPHQKDADDSQKDSSGGGGGGGGGVVGKSIGKSRSSESENVSLRQAAAIAALESRTTPRNSVVKQMLADANAAGELDVHLDGSEPPAIVTTPRPRKRGSLVDSSSGMAPTTASASTTINRRANGSRESTGSVGSGVSVASEDPPSRRRTASKSSASATTAAAAAAVAATAEPTAHSQSPAPAPVSTTTAPAPAPAPALASTDRSVESLRNLVGSVMVNVYEQRQDIDRLTKMIEGLVKVVQGKQSE